MTMSNVKTAISIDKALFQEIESMAQELEISRSRFFMLAAQEFIQRKKNRRLLEAINAAYEDSPDEEEIEVMRRMKKHARTVVDEWK